MRIVEGVGIAILTLLAILATLFFRRAALARGRGTIEMGVRLSTLVPGRGWANGVGRFANDELRWYRTFSFSWRPRRTLSRSGLAVEGRRAPNARERLGMPADWIIVTCVSRQAPVEVAMAERTLAGFLSWVETAPRGEITDPPRWQQAS